MISHHSKIADIENYIEKLELLSLTQEENNQLTTILQLENIINNQTLKDLISEDLKDENWIQETQILIHTCLKRKEKAQIIQEYLQDCYGFLIFKILEDKLKKIDMLYFQQPCHFFEDKAHSIPWKNKKLLHSLQKKNIQFLIYLDNKWLQSHRDLFFKDIIFEDINQLLARKKSRESLSP